MRKKKGQRKRSEIRGVQGKKESVVMEEKSSNRGVRE